MRTQILLIILCTIAGRVDGQCLTGNAGIQLSEQSEISLITVNPGHQIQSYWGHTALRIKDPLNNIDLLYNYGAFQFDVYFVPKFVYGKLDYILCVNHMRQAVRNYKLVQKRALIEQNLRLTLEEKQEIFVFVENNALPENRTYRYDFLFDNCSTRIRDLIEDVLGERLTYTAIAPESTFRQLLHPYINHLPFLGLGIDLALGMPVEQKPTARQLMGLPLYMMEAYDAALVEVDGLSVPLVTAKDTLFTIPGQPENTENWSANLILYGTMWGILFIAIWISVVEASRAAGLRLWFDRVVFGTAGAIGLLAVFLWFVSLHEVTNFNVNLLWAWPSHLVLLCMLSRKPEASRRYMRVCTVLMGVVVLGWLIWPQELHLALLPLILALLVRSAWRGWYPAANKF